MSKDKLTLTELERSNDAGGKIFLQTALKNNGSEGFKLTLTDGINVWEGAVTEEDLDQLCVQVKMDFNSFVDQTQAAFTKDVTGDANYECHFVEKGDNTGQLTWKKIPAHDVKYNLGSTTLKKCKNSSQKICDILSECIATTRNQQDEIHSLETANEKLSSERQSALKRLERCVKAKEELEKDLYSKFVAILNSKKERIRQLEEQCNNQDNEMDENSNSPIASTSNQQLLTTRNGQRGKKVMKSASEESDSEPEVSPAKKGKNVVNIPSKAVLESSLDFGLDEETASNEPPVVRRSRRQTSNKKNTPAKPVLPRVTSGNTTLERPKSADRRSSLRKSGSGNSNKSADNLDPDDLLDNF
uniref:DNA repair protein XRCC4 n=1 Tax=Biomphalaria glabrata TaxID=6526 RepID=A0A2C9M9X4_BIOGL